MAGISQSPVGGHEGFCREIIKWVPMDCSLPGSSAYGIFQARYCSGLPFPSPGDLPDPGIELRSPALQADALPSEPPYLPHKMRQKFVKKRKGFEKWGGVCVCCAQSGPTHCESMDGSPPGSSVHGISQARILEQGIISSSRESFQHRNRTCISCVSSHWQADSWSLVPHGKPLRRKNRL